MEKKRLTAEEILYQRDEHGCRKYWIGTYSTEKKLSVDDAIKAMQEFASQESSAKDERIKELEEVLREIANPIKYLQDKCKAEGTQLNGMMAIELGDNASYLKEIARKALSTKPEEK